MATGPNPLLELTGNVSTDANAFSKAIGGEWSSQLFQIFTFLRWIGIPLPTEGATFKDVSNALRTYQQAFNLKADGTLNAATKGWMRVHAESIMRDKTGQSLSQLRSSITTFTGVEFGQTAAPPSPPAAPPSPPAAPPQPSGGGGGGTVVAGGGGAPATPTLRPNASDEELEAFIREHKPHLMWVLTIPELKELLKKGASEGWTNERFQGELGATEWWKTTRLSERNFLKLQAEDPAEADAQLAQEATRIGLRAQQVLGVELEPGRARTLAERSLRLGWGDDQLNAALGGEFQRIVKAGQEAGGDAATIDAQYRALAEAYAVPVSDKAINQWVRKTIEGAVDQDNVRDYFAEQAKSLFPTLTNVIDRGITVRDYVQPYLQLAAQITEINPSEIRLTDPKWSRMLSARTDGGDHHAMTLDEWARTLRTDARYGYDKTQQARAQAADLSKELQQTFGALG